MAIEDIKAIPYDQLPQDRFYWLCGAHGPLCIDSVFQQLRAAGYRTAIYTQACELGWASFLQEATEAFEDLVELKRASQD
ncbi:MAG: hypothetical protein ABIG95_01825 [Candidatus Woesearchaeota archaeon]